MLTADAKNAECREKVSLGRYLSGGFEVGVKYNCSQGWVKSTLHCLDWWADLRLVKSPMAISFYDVRAEFGNRLELVSRYADIAAGLEPVRVTRTRPGNCVETELDS
jgi:hypothetical protein